MDPSLFEPLPSFAILELTTRCNLRCVYCALAQPQFHGQDLALDRVAIVAELRRAGFRDVQISGHGESTIVPGWHELARALVEAGMSVNLTSNLSRRLEPEEVDAFARMRCITLSCDTVDPELFAKLRRPAKLERVEENVARLQRAFPPRDAGRPYMAVNCTLNHRVVDGLPELVRWTHARDFDAISLVNLFEYPAVDPEFPVRHPAHVDPAGALARIREARTLALELGLHFHVMDGLYTQLEEALSR